MSNKQTLSFHVSGMHCASCASNTTRKLSKAPGVTSASVNYANEQATVTINDQETSIEKLADAVKSATGPGVTVIATPIEVTVHESGAAVATLTVTTSPSPISPNAST